MSRLALAAAFAASILAGSDAVAFVRTTTELGTPIYWAGNCVYLTPDSGGTPDLPPPMVLDALDRSVQSWQSVTLGACSYLAFHVEPAASVEAHLDHKNVLKFRTDKWCRPGEKNTPEMCYSPSAAAYTTIFFKSDPGKPGDGQILDADIELNDINFTFVIEPTTTQPRQGTIIADLENTLTHELGHFQGLDHTCWDHVTPTAPIGDDGKPIPDCADVVSHRVPDDVYLRVTQATMFDFSNPGEVIKRSPEADDVSGICNIYPIGKDPGLCGSSNGDGGVPSAGAPDGGFHSFGSSSGGCSIGARNPAWLPAWVSLLLLATLVQRRRT